MSWGSLSPPITLLCPALPSVHVAKQMIWLRNTHLWCQRQADTLTAMMRLWLHAQWCLPDQTSLVNESMLGLLCSLRRAVSCVGVRQQTWALFAHILSTEKVYRNIGWGLNIRVLPLWWVGCLLVWPCFLTLKIRTTHRGLIAPNLSAVNDLWGGSNILTAEEWCNYSAFIKVLSNMIIM